jgi:hypothetical protein
MEKEFKQLIEALDKFEGVKILDSSPDFSWIHFKLMNETTLNALNLQINEIKEYYPCNLLVLASIHNAKDYSYQIVIEEIKKEETIKMILKKLNNVLDSHGDLRKAKYKELGLPDMTLLTIRQMAAELKERTGLVFALVWIENAERDNIAIEGSGNPTQLVGLLTRGGHMAIEWADKNIKFFKPKEED